MAEWLRDELGVLAHWSAAHVRLLDHQPRVRRAEAERIVQKTSGHTALVAAIWLVRLEERLARAASARRSTYARATLRMAPQSQAAERKRRVAASNWLASLSLAARGGHATQLHSRHRSAAESLLQGGMGESQSQDLHPLETTGPRWPTNRAELRVACELGSWREDQVWHLPEPNLRVRHAHCSSATLSRPTPDPSL